jgi:hypothetical protein
MDHDEMVQKVQDGEMTMLDFLLEQEELTEQYLADMASKGLSPDPANAEAWLNKQEEYIIASSAAI